MKRKMIQIDEDKCTGCALCIPNCPEGALQIIDGKARLVGELLCDGLGACVGKCPEGAMTVEEREAEDYDERKVMDNVVKAGEAVLAAHLKHLKDHAQDDYLATALAYMKEKEISIPSEKAGPTASGCPGSMAKSFKREEQSLPVGEVPSQLEQWPVQLTLLNPQAPYFKNADIVIAADCVAFSYGNFHADFLKGKALIIFCPKLDLTKEAYVTKMADIFRLNDVHSISVIHMEVPCCFGTVALVNEALKRSGKDFPVEKVMISLRGEIISREQE